MAYEATHISDFGSDFHDRPTLQSGPDWSDEEDAILVKLWAEGVSFAVIAKALNARFKPIHRTRNACVGRAHRLGLRRATPTYRQSAPRQKKVRAPSAPRLRPRLSAAIVEPPPILPPIGVTDIVEAAAGTCRFMCGDPKQAHQFCGHPGEPWCPAHRAVVYGRNADAPPTGHVGQALRRRGRLVAMATTQAFNR